MKYKLYFSILFFFISSISFNNTYSQSEFLLSVKDFLWQTQTRDYINLIVLISLKNIGTEAGVDEDINQMYLFCSPPTYKYGNDITFVKFNNDINQSIQPGEEKIGYIIYKIPLDANDLNLKFPENLGGNEKLVCFSFLHYNSKDASNYLDQANIFLDKQEYTSALVNLLKAECINPYLHLNSEIDSVFNLFTQTDNSSTYYELFSNILSEQTEKDKILNTPDKIPVKLKGDLYFCQEYRDGKEIGRASEFSIGASGVYLTIGLFMNREIGIDKLNIKVVYNGLLFDVTKSNNEYAVKPEWINFFISNVFFNSAGTYTVSAYHSDGRLIAKNKVKMVLK